MFHPGRFLKKHVFLRDGMVTIAVAFAWNVGLQIWCTRGEGIVCSFFYYLMNVIQRPALLVMNGLADLAFKVTGIIPPAPGGTEDRRVDLLMIGIGISAILLYWFLLGGAVCFLWRFARNRIQGAFVKRTA